MAGPGDEVAAAGRLRVSYADREQVIEALKVAFVEERLAKGEFDLLVGRVFTVRTHTELAAVTVGLPTRPVPASEPSTVAYLNSEPPVLRPGRLITLATAACAGVWMLGFLVPWPRDSEGDPPHGVALLVYLTTFLYLFVLAMTGWLGGAVMVQSWLRRRKDRRTPTSAHSDGSQASSRAW